MVRPRRILRISFNPLVLTLSVALGVWLGFIAIGLTTYVGYRLYTADNKAPVAEVFIPPPAPPQAEPEPAPAPPSTGEKRLQKYEENYNAAQRGQRAPGTAGGTAPAERCQVPVLDRAVPQRADREGQAQHGPGVWLAGAPRLISVCQPTKGSRLRSAVTLTRLD
ncbi:hypothetical protein [Pseudomonas sp. JM0905a]|uniref:hypothetical protein n=1 Tax=Pseudomonas sp. JM0905a TaxID=2772484 RepID=UPI001CC24162|nr:hypothetical protein [Pseudomonas sp. JM0905a]